VKGGEYLDLKLAVVQMDCSSPADVDRRLDHVDSCLRAAAGADMALLPEGVFDRAEPIPGPITAQLSTQARAHRCYVVCGLPERGADGLLYNSSVLISPAGELIGKYRKVHLFGTERNRFTAGHEPAIFDTEFGRVALTICYDLIFPEYIRALALRGAQLILNSTNWNTDSWQTSIGWSGSVVTSLASTRALENTVHVAMADRVGARNGRTSLGHSCIVSPSGSLLANAGPMEDVAVATISLDHENWTEWRTIATYLGDRRTDLYERLMSQS
jgi:5-aminopentanamidase